MKTEVDDMENKGAKLFKFNLTHDFSLGMLTSGLSSLDKVCPCLVSF